MVGTTNKAPNVPLSKFKRTKIIVTIGPATNSYNAILALLQTGANGLRLNFSHGDYDERTQQIQWIRKASADYGKPVSIIQDLQGPKLRLGDFEGFITIQKGQMLSFAYKADYGKTKHIPTQYDLAKKVKRGERLYLFDGKVRTTIISVRDGVVHAQAENDGVITKRKGMNLPDTDLAGDILTTKDRKDLAYGTTHDIDYVAISFVQTAADVHKAQTLLRSLGSKAKVIAKIETKVALDHLDAIVEAADAVMVARGDLAIEAQPEVVPVAQRQIIALGEKYATPTIVATQMLASMTDAPEPTRAEVSDVATAVLLGADSVMLSDETANGHYPIESVQVMKQVITYTQNTMPPEPHYKSDNTHYQNSVCNAIIRLAQDIAAKAIVAETASGATALQIAARRPKMPIIAVTSDVRVAQQLAIVYGTKSYVRPVHQFAATKLTNWLREHKILKKGDMIVTASGQHPGVVGTTDTIKVRVLE